MDQPEPLISRIGSVIRRHFGRLWLAALWPYLAEVVVILCVRVIVQSLVKPAADSNPMGLWDTLSIGQRCAMLLGFVIMVYWPRDLARAGIAMLVAADQQGDTLTLPAFASRIIRILPVLVALSLVWGSLILGGTIFLIVPGIFFEIWSAFVMPALALNESDEWSAVRRSLRLSLGRFGQLLVAGLLTAIAATVGIFICEIPVMATAHGPNWWLGWLIALALFLAVVSLTVMVWSVAVAVLYLDAVRAPQMVEPQTLT
jgi:hypothetical protein